MKKILTFAVAVVSAAFIASCGKSTIAPTTDQAQITISHPTLDANRTITFNQTADPSSLIAKHVLIGAFTVDPNGKTIKLGAVGGTVVLQGPYAYGYNQVDHEIIGPLSISVQGSNDDPANDIDSEDLAHQKTRFNLHNFKFSVPTTFLVWATINSKNSYLGGDGLRFDVTGDDVSHIIAYDAKGHQLMNDGQGVALSGSSIGATNSFEYYYYGGYYNGGGGSY